MKKFFLSALVGFMFFQFVNSTPVFPDKKQGWQKISAEALNQLLSQETKNFLLINTLSPIEFRDCSIPKSINIPYEKITTTDKLPVDKNFKIILYCCSELCVLSNKAADILVRQGYQNIFVLDGGLPAWKLKGYPTVCLQRVLRVNILSLKPEALKKTMGAENGLIILDIRPNNQYVEKYLPNSINIPFFELEHKYTQLPLDKTIIVVDKIGHRSFIAARYLRMKGIDNVWRLFGGIEEWQLVFGEDSFEKNKVK